MMTPQLAAVFCLVGLAFAAPSEPEKYIFQEEFDELDYEIWQHERTMSGGGNWEFQIYDNNRTNSYVRDGILYIKPGMADEMYNIFADRVDLWGGSDANFCTQNEWYGCERIGNPTNIINPVTSARIRSSRGFNMRYGRIEVRARMPKGDWLWPAIWMMPQWEEYGGWPASGEIDIVESRGNLDLRNENGDLMGHQHAAQTMHWGPWWAINEYQRTQGEREGDFGDSFHLYQVEWTATYIRFMIDDVETFRVDPPAGGFWEIGDFESRFPDGIANPWEHGSIMAPFDKKFYFILNVAVGGTNGFFPDGWTNANGAKPWENTSGQAFLDFWNGRGDWMSTWNGEDAAMAIDYIRVTDL